MSISIRTVKTRRQLKRFIRFNYELYKGSEFAVPDLEIDLLNTFNRDKNAAYEFCSAKLFLAYKKGKLVGRVAAIINRRANQRWDKKTVRFGWIDFIDDERVSAALLKAVEHYGRVHGMTDIEGPLGFTDMDNEGMLIEGFDRLGTISTIYNYPYYSHHLERLGYTKAADWIEYFFAVPNSAPDKMLRISDMVQQRFGLRVKKLRNRRELRKGDYGRRIFEVINESFKPLYGYSEMTSKQIDAYVKQYIPLLDLRMISIIENAAGEVVAAGITMPSMARAMQKARGRLFPFGWWHLLKALYLKRSKVLDLLLIGVKPEYQNKGVNAMIFCDLIPVFYGLGFEHAESNVELETNTAVQSQWQFFEREQHKRRRAYKKSLSQE